VRWLKRKVDAGATKAITQFFFDADAFFRFRDDCVAAGIHVPIIPGILPIQSWAGTKRFAACCGARVPAKLDEAFATAARDGREALLALAQCTALCDRLMSGGVEDLHFYTLNRPHLVREVVRAVGISPQIALEKVA
jgi:methylenetetrahydrofolate reductase (NADPH)